MLFIGEKDLFLNDDDPHLKQTIFPPKDLSETRSELPQFKQIFILFILNFKNFLITYLSIFINLIVKISIYIKIGNENLLQ